MYLDFKRNLGTTDKIIRVGTGLSIIALAFKLTRWFKIIATIISTLLFVDVACGYCILYDLMGWSTKKSKSSS